MMRYWKGSIHSQLPRAGQNNHLPRKLETLVDVLADPTFLFRIESKPYTGDVVQCSFLGPRLGRCLLGGCSSSSSIWTSRC